MLKKILERLGQIWNYFKKGRNEIGLIFSVYSMILTYSIKFNVDFSITDYIGFSIVFGIACILLGVFLAEKIEPENNRISPYAQDGLKSAIFLQESLINFYNSEFDKAIDNMNKAQELRKKWLR